MSSKIKLLTCFLFIGLAVFSQQNQSSRDSIVKKMKLFVNYYYEGSRFGDALAISEDLLKTGEQIKSDSLIARANNYLGLSFSALKDKKKAIKYYKKSLDLYKKLNITQEIVDISINIGIAYSENDDFESAKTYYFEALKYAKTESQKAHVYHDLGYDYGRNGFYKESIEYINKALPLTIQNKEEVTEGYSYLALFYAHYNIGNTDLANSFYDKGMKHARSINNLDITFQFFKDRLNQLKKENNPQEAFKIVDSIFKYQNILKEREALNVYKEIEGKLHIKDNDEKLRLIEKEQKIQSLLNMTLALLLSALLIFGFILFKKNKRLNSLNINLKAANNTIKNSLLEKELLEQQLESIQDDIMTDIQDNFGNRLNNISNSYNAFLSLFKTEDVNSDNLSAFKEKLENSLKKLTEDLKVFLWVNKSKNNSLIVTLNKLELYIYNLTGNNKNINIDIETSLFKDEYKLPKYWNRQLFLILREAIENALKYSNPSYIIINFSIDKNNKLTIVVADNGNNFNRDDLLNSPYIFNIKRRAETMGNTIKFEPENSKIINKIVIEGSIPNI